MSLDISQQTEARLAEEARGSSTSARRVSTRRAGRLLNCRSGDLA
jgi:hypothetical protein